MKTGNMADKFNKMFVYWLAFLPLVVFDGRYEGPKIIYFWLGSVVLLVFWIIRVLRNSKGISLSKEDCFYWVWLIILLFSSLFSAQPIDAIIGSSYRHQGVIFFVGLWVVGKTVAVLLKKKSQLLSRLLTVAVLVEAGLVVLQKITGNLYFGRPLGTLGDANAVAGFLAVGLFFVFTTLKGSKLLGGVVLTVLAVFLTQSRTGIVILLIIMIYRYILRYRDKLRYALIFPFIFVIFAIPVFNRAFAARSGSLFENRPLFWSMAIEAIKQKPYLGYGAESQELIYNDAFAKAEMPLEGMIVDRTHNLFLDVAVWSGIIGLVLFGSWLVLVFVKIGRSGRGDKAVFLLAWLIFALVQPLGVTHWLLLFIIAYL